ncbi:MAG TPA: ribulose-phosphate 3-epimerase [Sedimentisphaerales bacterium]|nr:ribulose-phosphate 3-epimerase [Sedimentisphaerales bacterium]HQG48869.1 ribulose-phosphate 3-epimerase [Sedimentisphaerales bacterium]HQI27739.1 ribulose-phosphate 3-epimerase [Sedimentisphaerales bacterium]
MNKQMPKAGTVEIVPSILSADFARLADEIAVVASAGVKMLHLDVMDGHFVPNITIGPPVIAKLRKHSDLFFDSHLMISEPARYIEAFAKAGVNNITFHIEVTDEPERIVEQIHALGCTAGITLNPETPVESIRKVAPLCEMVLVMTVRPGFGGQSFMADAARKVIEVRRMVGPHIRVEVDGGIDPDTTPIVVSYGADTLVAGNAIFGQADRIAAIEALRKAGGKG